MFTRKELDSIDRDYFEVIVANDYDVTLMSKNTHHIWRLHNAELPVGDVIVIFHKHHASDPYHLHGRCGTLNGASREIKRHDLYQLNGRKTIARQA